MSNKTPRKSKYTSAGGRAFMTMLVATIKTLANVTDDRWLRFSNLIINNIKNDWQLGYGIRRKVLNTFNNLSGLKSFVTKIKEMNSNGVDLNWVRNNLEMTNLMMALAHEQINGYSYNKQLEVFDNWDDNPAMRYIDTEHLLNQASTPEDFDYQ